MLFVWKRITDDYGSIGGYTFDAFVLYYLLYSIIRNFKASDISYSFEVWIKDGELSSVLLKPINPITYLIVRESARILIETVLSMLIFIPIIFSVSGFKNSLDLTFQNVFFVVLFSFGSFIFTSFLYLNIGSFSFWTKSVSGVKNLIQQFVEILRGGWFPLDLAPIVFQKILFVLPFSYTLFVPIKILIEGVSEINIVAGLISVSVLSILLLSLLILLWKRGLKQYESVGN